MRADALALVFGTIAVDGPWHMQVQAAAGAAAQARSLELRSAALQRCRSRDQHLLSPQVQSVSCSSVERCATSTSKSSGMPAGVEAGPAAA